MPKSRRRSRHRDAQDTQSGPGTLYIDEDRELDEEALLGLLDPDFSPVRRNSGPEDFSWDVYLETSMNGRRYR